MLIGIAVLTVWVPRVVGQTVDGLVAGTLHGAALRRELVIAAAMGLVIYLLRVGWRLQLFAAAYQLGVELRTRLYDRLTLQGPPFFNRSRTGDLMARATNDVDSIEMAAGEAFLAGFDGTLTLILVIAMMALGIDWRLALIALLPFPLMAFAFWFISRRVHSAWRDVARSLFELNDHVQETIAGVRTLRALGLEAHAGARLRAARRGRCCREPEALKWEAAYEPAVGFTLTAATALDARCRRLARVAAAADGGRADELRDVSVAVDLADVCGRLGAVAAGARQGRVDAACSRPCPSRCRLPTMARSLSWRQARCGLTASRSAIDQTRACDRRCVVRAGRRPNAGNRRADRLRQVDAARVAAASLRAGAGPHRVGRPRRSTTIASNAARRDQLGAAGAVPVLGDARRKHRACAQRRNSARSNMPRNWRRCTTTSSAFRTATKRWSASAA